MGALVFSEAKTNIPKAHKSKPEILAGFSLQGGWGSHPQTSRKFSPPSWFPTSIFYPPIKDSILPLNSNFHVITQWKLHCFCTIFTLTSCSLYTQVMLILILINVQYLQKVVFSFDKESNSQNSSFLGSHHPIKIYLRSKISHSPHLEKSPHP